MENMKISGYTVVHNAIEGDYCIKECLESLLPVCDEVVVGHAASTDGTGELLASLASQHSKLRIVEQPWKQPFNDPRWFVRWINETRIQLRGANQLMLDADEVLDAEAGKLLHSAMPGVCYRFHRLNFWRDGQTLIGKGETCGWTVARYGPASLFMPSDEPYSDDAPEILKRAVSHPALRIFHYGFLRNRSGMLAKSKVNIPAFKGTWDIRLSRMAMHPETSWHNFFKHELPFECYTGDHPMHCHAWLRDHSAL